jgi:hypothetical protein
MQGCCFLNVLCQCLDQIDYFVRLTLTTTAMERCELLDTNLFVDMNLHRGRSPP